MAASYPIAVQNLQKTFEVEDSDEAATMRMGCGVYVLEGDDMAQLELLRTSQSVSEKPVND